MPSLRALAQLADPALDGRLDRRQDGRRRGVDLLELFHRGEELPVAELGTHAEIGEGVEVGALHRLRGTAPPRAKRRALRLPRTDAAHALYANWEKTAGECVATLHLYAGRHADDP
ncbi:hypothetical protein [Streptomyces kutzneri]|uniref:hypothetical protein n=1 Tax=Streptomyces kutzneri TaxID=3051179 RepID=UPI003F95A016